MARRGKKMTEDHKIFYIGGAGDTKELAALDFIENFDKQFPKEEGTYELIIKYPLAYSFETFYGANRQMHIYRLRGSFKLVNKHIFEVK